MTPGYARDNCAYKALRMTNTIALVASKNKVKALAAEDALQTFCGQTVNVSLADKGIHSGVPDQPLSLTETGKDLNEAMEIEIGVKDTDKSIGFYNWLTAGNIERRSSSAEAVLIALYGFQKGKDT